MVSCSQQLFGNGATKLVVATDRLRLLLVTDTIMERIPTEIGLLWKIKILFVKPDTAPPKTEIAVIWARIEPDLLF